jgi:ABC-type multidrug transport system permease subunit
MQRRVLWEVAKTTFREFWRTPEAMFWTYGFPLVMTLVLGFAFKPRPPDPLPVAVVGAPSVLAALTADPRLKAEPMTLAEADMALARGRVAAMVSGSVLEPKLRSDPVRPESELALLLVQRALRAQADPETSIRADVQNEDRPGSRYIDFLVPGLLGLNLLGSGMWGIGFQLVTMRTHNLLRRLMVTPMGKAEFLVGFLLSRLLLVVPEVVAIILFGTLVFGVPFRGSVLAVGFLVLLGAMCFTGLGMLVASRAKSIEGVAGLMNLVQIPMWLLGGSFFSNERFQGVLRWCADALPLTQLNRALRDCMLEPVGFGAVWGQLAYLAVFAAVCFCLALRLFRWT